MFCVNEDNLGFRPPSSSSFCRSWNYTFCKPAFWCSLHFCQPDFSLSAFLPVGTSSFCPFGQTDFLLSGFWLVIFHFMPFLQSDFSLSPLTPVWLFVFLLPPVWLRAFCLYASLTSRFLPLHQSDFLLSVFTPVWFLAFPPYASLTSCFLPLCQSDFWLSAFMPVWLLAFRLYANLTSCFPPLRQSDFSLSTFTQSDSSLSTFMPVWLLTFRHYTSLIFCIPPSAILTFCFPPLRQSDLSLSANTPVWLPQSERPLTTLLAGLIFCFLPFGQWFCICCHYSSLTFTFCQSCFSLSTFLPLKILNFCLFSFHLLASHFAPDAFPPVGLFDPSYHINHIWTISTFLATLLVFLLSCNMYTVQPAYAGWRKSHSIEERIWMWDSFPRLEFWEVCVNAEKVTFSARKADFSSEKVSFQQGVTRRCRLS